MNLLEIRLKNFRQFYGDQSIQIAPPGPKNVTVVHAENGVGKTTLLNAVLWTFFGDTTKKFEQKEKILNFAAEEEQERTATVELTFEHEDVQYKAIRAQTLTGAGHAKIRFDVMRIEKNKSLSAPLLNPESFINTVIPRAMAPYFFFDGEQAETFSSETNYKAVASAIRDILGCTTIETAIDDLRYVERGFNKDLSEVKGDEELKRVEDSIEKIEEATDRRRQRIKELDQDIGAMHTQLAIIGDKLRSAQEAREIQIDREARQRELETITAQAIEAETEVLRWIERKGIAVIAESLTNFSLGFIDEESLRGKIPSPYNEDFVMGLLKAGICICERPIPAGTNEWRSVQALLKSAGNAEAMSRVVRARSRIEVLKESRGDASRLLEHEQQKIAVLTTKGRELEQTIAELGKKLENLPVAEIQERERARKELERKLEAAKTERTRNQVENERDEEDLKRLNEQVSELAQKSIQARRLLARRDLASKAGEFLKKVLVAYEHRAREDIEKTVNKILEKTARRLYTLAIDEQFELKLMFSDGRSIPKSSGENQLMSLAFIAALVQFAQRRSEEQGNELFIPATVAPLVLDSPFGQLDDSYRADTAAFVPQMAPQVVLMLSSSQSKEEVIGALGERIGAEYVLIAENVGLEGDKKQDYINIDGNRMATTLFNCQRNLTRIQKVS